MKTDCHDGNPLVFDTGTVKVYAGGTNNNGGWHRMTPIPDLAMGPIGVIKSAKTLDILPVSWSSSQKLVGGETPIVFEIDWPDYGIPTNLGPSYWKALVKDIEAHSIKTISCQCMGGHGRTGVQLSILAHLLIPKKQHTWETAGELITHIRDSYCKKAVESGQQQTYVADVCGIPEGDSVIVITKNAWADIEYDDSMLLTEDELNVQLAADEKRAAKKPKKPKNKKPKDKKPKDKKVNAPIKKGWTLTRCGGCDLYEWRRAWYSDLSISCNTCGEGRPAQADEELLKGLNMVTCFDTHHNWHPVEMYSDTTSYMAEAERQGLQVRTSDGDIQIRVDNTWVPTWFLRTQSNGNIVSASANYQRRAVRQEDVGNFKIRGPKKHQAQTTLDSYRTARRQTNDEIESED